MRDIIWLTRTKNWIAAYQEPRTVNIGQIGRFMFETDKCSRCGVGEGRHTFMIHVCRQTNNPVAIGKRKTSWTLGTVGYSPEINGYDL